jgi:hypothetical protein
MRDLLIIILLNVICLGLAIPAIIHGIQTQTFESLFLLVWACIVEAIVAMSLFYQIKIYKHEKAK